MLAPTMMAIVVTLVHITHSSNDDDDDDDDNCSNALDVERVLRFGLASGLGSLLGLLAGLGHLLRRVDVAQGVDHVVLGLYRTSKQSRARAAHQHRREINKKKIIEKISNKQ